MTERPMLFSAPMVQALLREPNPKSQTRRIIKPQPMGVLGLLPVDSKRYPAWWFSGGPPPFASFEKRCPYGVPGDVAWVKETYRLHRDLDPRRPSEAAGQAVWYEADNASLGHLKGPLWGKLRPSIHMPRSFSRIELEITDVRVERLNDISEADALAEGIEHRRVDSGYPGADLQDAYFFGGGHDEGYNSALAAYRALWERINGAGSWDLNPWIWAVTFRRTRPTKAVLASAR